MSYFKTNDGAHIYYEDFGKGKPIVLIHGWPLSHHMFEPQIAPLVENGFRVITLDLRGFGESSATWDGLDYDTWCNDIAHLIQILDLKDATLGGFSMGGAIALRYVTTKKDPRIVKLALFGSAGPCFVSKDDFPQGVPVEAVQHILERVHTDRPMAAHEFTQTCLYKPVSEVFQQWFDAIQLRGSAHAFVCGMEELRDHDFRASLTKITIPTRIFHGVRDKIVPFALGEYQQRQIDGSTLVRFEDSGHGLNFDETEKLNAELIKFLREEDQGRQVA